MKAIFIAYNQAYNQEIVELLENLGQRGYTVWEEIGAGNRIWGATRGLRKTMPFSPWWKTPWPPR